MIIKADKEGVNVISQLCDIALRHNGIKDLQNITTVLNSIELIEEKKVKQKLEGKKTKKDKK